MRDPLAVDALLVFFGGVFAVVSWAALTSNQTSLSLSAAGAGVAGTVVLAVLVGRYYAQLPAFGRWVSSPAETPRARARVALLIVAAILVRLSLGLLPDTAIPALFGVAVAMVALGLGHSLWRWHTAPDHSSH
ncbi:hypothetical protein HISP_01965 [Haloarcula hispanica N601]|uniref:Uncharacterized protein n=1 Tax=Haloarcula hispanica N601 TaxID=1417673 RepID=V5TS63_HALHI|nr:MULTISPECIES: hypothetical protein [Haloarcula]AHB67429.1 hypothetical protein HISP_01965 [Haloarcula hispanica N601]AJF25992.1 hypothetical protein SG26_09775 [Haloarcula sp. CBA1115]KAA9405371.1 hypothetical protein Har1131_00510 [Haloarcula sp. CBA1131]KZX49858.1 hypothetical protein AV929_15235 [Haloarcula sp. K1]MUV50585.1 hypothetical protein [Haloarcula sp. CBA1122]